MSTVKLELIKTDSDFIKAVSNAIVSDNGNKWYYMPYWFEEIGSGLFVQHSFDELPIEIKNIIKSKRESQILSHETNRED
jgi:hypothetical protein